MKAYSKCPKLYCWNFIEGIELIEKPDAMKIGTYVDNYISGEINQVEMSENTTENIWLAKARAICRVIDELELIAMFGKYDKQKKFTMESERFDITGTLDFAASYHLGELKVSASPEFYLSPWYIGEQAGTYLMSNPNYQYVRMFVIQVPELRINENKETQTEYELRCVDDMLRRPGYYFHGYNAENEDFGINFVRGEFDLVHLLKKYNWIVDSMIKSKQEDFWPDRRSECKNPVQCNYWYACNFGVSEDRYKKTKKEESK